MKTGSALSREKGEKCSPDELRRVQQGERRLENLKKMHSWKALVACAKYELQIVDGRTGRRNTKTENRKRAQGAALKELGKEKEAAQKAEESARRKTPCIRSL